MTESWASSPAVRRSMVGNRSRGTAPELRLRRALRALGLRGYHVNREGADVVFTRRRVAVFVDGCFWHGCPSHWRPPRTNPMYWALKVATNTRRDRALDEVLASRGWLVVRVWEHQPVDEAAAAVAAALEERAA